MNTRIDQKWGLLFFVKLAGGALLVLVAFLAGALLSNEPVNAQKPAKEDGRRTFYLTQSFFDGSQALNACATGFHMASIYEILDPSNLKYDTTLGITNADSGSGPPQGPFKGGWIRTGFGSLPEEGPSVTTPVAGNQNCAGWRSNTSQGTTVQLIAGWEAHEGAYIHPWWPGLVSCSEQLRVWCVKD